MKPRHGMQIGIGTMLMLTACVAGYVSAYRFGVDELMAYHQHQITSRNYDMSDLLSGNTARTEIELAELQRVIELADMTLKKTGWTIETGSRVKGATQPNN